MEFDLAYLELKAGKRIVRAGWKKKRYFLKNGMLFSCWDEPTEEIPVTSMLSTDVLATDWMVET